MGGWSRASRESFCKLSLPFVYTGMGVEGQGTIQISAEVREGPSFLPGSQAAPALGTIAVLKLLWSTDPGSPQDPFRGWMKLTYFE